MLFGLKGSGEAGPIELEVKPGWRGQAVRSAKIISPKQRINELKDGNTKS